MPQQTLRTPHDAFRVGGIGARVLCGDGVLYRASGQQWKNQLKNQASKKLTIKYKVGTYESNSHYARY